MKKIISIIAVVIVIVLGAFWAKGYYNDRYVATESYYTQVPIDEVNKESWLVDANGVKQEKGKKYDLIGYDEQGNSKELNFVVRGTPENYYTPGTYIKVDSSKTITLGESIVEKQNVPEKALGKIEQQGTRK